MSSRPSGLDEARVLWNYHRLGLPVGPVDVIVGLGSYDLRVADRCVQLWQSGLAPWVVFSGSRGNWTEGQATTEALLFSERAQSLGLPSDVLILEDQSTNLGQNVTFTQTLLKNWAILADRILLVTKPNTERRALATAARVGSGVDWSVTSPDTRLEGPYAPGRTFETLVDEMVGDLDRIVKYPDLGFQVPQNVPVSVLAAFETLKAQGFTRHLLKG